MTNRDQRSVTAHGGDTPTPKNANKRTFGQLPALDVPDTFDDPLPDAETATWEAGATEDDSSSS